MEEKARTGNRTYFFGIGILITLLLITMYFVLSAITAHPAHAHDWKRPELDGWYSSLTSRGGALGKGISCCSKEDCHVTDAEIRNGEWWARLGIKHTLPNGESIFEPGDWKQVPKEIVDPRSNPAGEAVICHPQVFAGQTFVTSSVPIYCFIPPNQV